MFEAHSIRAEHKDVIHDAVYDYYGQRMATCSSDQNVKVSFVLISYFYNAFIDYLNYYKKK